MYFLTRYDQPVSPYQDQHALHIILTPLKFFFLDLFRTLVSVITEHHAVLFGSFHRCQNTLLWNMEFININMRVSTLSPFDIVIQASPTNT